MESKIIEMQTKIDDLMKENGELRAIKLEYNSKKQSLTRLTTRLRKLCKRLSPEKENVIEMQQLVEEMKELVKLAVE